MLIPSAMRLCIYRLLNCNQIFNVYMRGAWGGGNEERVHLCEWWWRAYWTGNACADGRVMKAAQEKAHSAAACVYLYDSL